MRETLFLTLFFGIAAIVLLAVAFLAEPALQSLVPSAFEPIRRIDLISFALIFWLILKGSSDPISTKLDRLERKLSQLEKRASGSER